MGGAGLVCIALGLVTTVGVAWWPGRAPRYAAWCWTDPHVCIIREGRGITAIVWPDRHLDEYAAGLFAAVEHDRENFGRGWLRKPPPHPATLRVHRTMRPRTDIPASTGRLNRRVETEYGWPLRALWHWQDEEYGPVHGAIAWNDTAGRRERYPGQIWGGLPCLPVWKGLIVNTMVYGAAWAALLAVPLTVLNLMPRSRQRRRLRRGHCPQCNYDLTDGADSGCPECGWNRGGGC